MQSCIIIYSNIQCSSGQIFKLGQIMTRYNFVVTRRVHLCNECSCELRDIMTRYNFLVARQVIFVKCLNNFNLS